MVSVNGEWSVVNGKILPFGKISDFVAVETGLLTGARYAAVRDRDPLERSQRLRSTGDFAQLGFDYAHYRLCKNTVIARTRYEDVAT
ncbi:hypothetical protein DN068_17885 [Taibaiella soli]|uniref:Uncharacterized protein n=1 Tax=Taibaiella soli TaxID=1649169 RepID=A0A2W2BCX8_9BACT|nr:hypothetical protein DN068_17885 [Taibaiella soli]